MFRTPYRFGKAGRKKTRQWELERTKLMMANFSAWTNIEKTTSVISATKVEEFGKAGSTTP